MPLLPSIPKLRLAVSLVNHEDYRNGIMRGIRFFCEKHPEVEIAVAENPADLRGIACDGILANIQDETIDFFRSLKKPIVKIGARRDYPDISSVQMDNRSVGELGACHLMTHGHTNFGFLSIIDQSYARERREGFESQLTAFGLPCITLELREVEEFSMSSGPLVELWLAAIHGPSAVMGSTDLMARRLVELCRQAHIAVPGDTAVLGFNNGLVECLSAHPHLSSIPQERERLGYQSAELLVAQLRGQKQGVEKIYVRTRYIITRESTRPFVFNDRRLNELLDRCQTAAIDSKRTLADIFANEKWAHELRALFQAEAVGNDLRREHLRCQVLLSERLLRQTALSVDQAWELCGMDSRERFDGLFKLAFDMTPAAYRTRFENDPLDLPREQ